MTDNIYIQTENNDKLKEECGVFGVYDFDGHDVACQYGKFSAYYPPAMLISINVRIKSISIYYKKKTHFHQDTDSQEYRCIYFHKIRQT